MAAAARAGILMWIAALSVDLWLSAEMVDVAKATQAELARRRLLLSAASITLALVIWMIAFYNW